MKKETGLSLIEVLVVVGIIGILILMATPFFRNYMIRIKITEIINDASYYVREQQIAAASVADYDGASPSMRSLIDDSTLRPDTIYLSSFKCINGFESVGIEYKDKKKIERFAGSNAKYIYRYYFSGFVETPNCQSRPNSITSEDDIGYYIVIGLDPTTLGIPQGSIYAPSNMFIVATGGKQTYLNADGSARRVVTGAAATCGVWSGGMAIDNHWVIPKEALPLHCRYYSVPKGGGVINFTTTVRELWPLEGAYYID